MLTSFEIVKNNTRESVLGYLADIRYFGDVAAEQDADVLSYFLKTPAIDEILTGKKHLVLGRKGSGKTALVKYFSRSSPTEINVPVNLDNYPWKMHQTRRNLGVSDVESYVSSWKYFIAVQANQACLAQANYKMIRDSQKAADNFLTENYGGSRIRLEEILKPKSLKLSKSSFKPSVLGVSLGQVDFENSQGGVSPDLDALTNALIQNAIVMMNQQGIKRISFHFDELDKGLSTFDDSREQILIGLVLASRSFFGDSQTCNKISPIIYLRTDLWEVMSFSDKNKITNSSTVTLEWDSSSLKQLISRRIESKVGSGHEWDDIEDGELMRGSQPKWNHIVSRTLLRPRDVIQFLNIIAEIAIKEMPDADIIENSDIIAAREAYSKYFKGELDDEIKTHWPKWIEAIQAISDISTLTFTRSTFEKAWGKKRESSAIAADEALETLYQYSVIGYRRGIGAGGSAWAFQYTHPDAGWDNAAVRLQVHPGLKEFAKLREARDIKPKSAVAKSKV